MQNLSKYIYIYIYFFKKNSKIYIQLLLNKHIFKNIV